MVLLLTLRFEIEFLFFNPLSHIRTGGQERSKKLRNSGTAKKQTKLKKIVVKPIICNFEEQATSII